MKKTKDIIKIIGGLLIILCSFYCGYNYFNSIFRTLEADYGDDFKNLPTDSIDVIVLGSSHVQYSFIPSIFYEETGLYSYSLGTAAQPISVSYEMLKETLKTQNPELIILEIYTACKYTDNSNPENDYRYVKSEYMMTGQEKYNVIDMMSSKEKALSYKNEFINNHNNWRTIENINSLFEKNTSIMNNFGYIEQLNDLENIDNYWYSNKYYDYLDLELPDEVLEGLNNIYELCNDNNINLFLYILPIDNVTIEIETYKHLVWDWANEKGINYIDMLDNDYELDFRSMVHHDGYHTYISGASYTTDLLVDFIKNNYEFDSHKDNEILNERLVAKLGDYTVDVLNSEVNPNKYLNRLINYPYTYLVRYSKSDIDDNFRNYLNKMGLYDINGDYYYAVVKNNEILASSNEKVECELDNHQILIDNSGIYFDGELLCDDDSFNLVVFNDDYSEYSIKIIDYLYKTIWDKYYDYGYNYVG